MIGNGIGDYGVIGDLHTVALVGKDGSIDWCCLPHFDSPSVFGALLDRQKGGHFQIIPCDDGKRQQLYIPETNVLVTRFLHHAGVGEVTDFMPIECDERGKHPTRQQIVRIVSVTRGKIRFRLECAPAFNYSRDPHHVAVHLRMAVFHAGKVTLALKSPVPFRVENGVVKSEFTLAEGESLTFYLHALEEPAVRDMAENSLAGDYLLRDTVRFWRQWLAQCKYTGRWREMVQRSALILKLLTFAPTGAIVAAPTTSLPERIGGIRNWDYRYTWIRDAAFTVYALIKLGFTQEAGRFIEWLNTRCNELEPDGSLHPVYRIDGGRVAAEEILEWEGYRQSKPVRIGNEAFTQRQWDLYGALMDAVYLYNKHGLPIGYENWVNLSRLLDFVCANWEQPDEGIWEIRGGAQQFVYSKVMCWVALDRGLRLADKRGFPADRAKWIQTRDSIYHEVMCQGWNEEVGSFVQIYGSHAVDASALLMPLVFFTSPADQRMQSTVNRIIGNLASDSLVFRYQPSNGTSDGLPGYEGSFTLCSFWLVEALTRLGRLEEARLKFEKITSYANHLGLYAEQLSLTGEPLGNFPQAFSHIGLISSAFNLDRALGNGKVGMN